MRRGLLAVGAAAVLVLLLASPTNHSRSVAAFADSMHVRGVLCVDLACGEEAFGLEIVASINGVECARDTSGIFQEEGDPRVLAGFDITVPAAQDVPGCGTPNVPIEFTVDGRSVDQENYWYPSDNFIGQLWVGDAAYLSGYIIYDDERYTFPCTVLCDGPYLKAFVNGNLCGALQTIGNNYRSYFRYLIVAGADAKPGCAHDGDIVTFTVDDVPAHQEFAWEAGFLSSDVGVGHRSASFHGHACIDAECGEAQYNSPVIAKVGSVVCGEALTGKPYSDGEEQNYYDIAVAPTEKRAGCGSDGATVDFYIDGRKTQQSASWTDGAGTNLDIWVGGDFAAFSGRLTCSGEPCFLCFSPCPTVTVRAFINGIECGSHTPYGWLITSGYSTLIVKSADAKPGCGTDGATVNFTVDGEPAGETTVWSPGFNTRDLTAGDVLWGDTDCSGALDAVDVLSVIRQVIGQQYYRSCWVGTTLNLRPFEMHAKWSDFDCSGTIDLTDAIKILSAAAGLSIQQATGCPTPRAIIQAFPEP